MTACERRRVVLTGNSETEIISSTCTRAGWAHRHQSVHDNAIRSDVALLVWGLCR